MSRFRKKSPLPSTPTNSQLHTPTSPAEPAKRERFNLWARNNQGALAAPSNALSTVPVTCDLTDPAPNVNEPAPSKESVWRAAYGAAKIAVEATKESSDVFPPLKAVLGAISVLIKNYDQTTANVEQIKDIEKRIQSLGEILAPPVGDQDTEETARREALRKTLVGIVSKLEPLSEQHRLLRFLKNADHANTLNGFVQDLANAVVDYQLSLQRNTYENTKKIDGATTRIDSVTTRTDEATTRIDEATKRIEEVTKKTDDNTRNIIEAADMELLGKLSPVRDAGYQAGHHNMCFRGTRESVLDGILRWAKDPKERHVFWLNGLAGTGKSTIAQTFSERVSQNGSLGASFFCSRDYLDRQELKNIFPTLAYQLACRYPSFRTKIIQVIKRDPSAARNSLISQLQDLIVTPLSSTDISCVIVIDALDECIDDQPASALLSVLGRYVKNLPSVKIFITGRPETRIRSGFRLPLLEPLTQIFLLHGIELAKVDEDIRLYLQEKLVAVAKRRSDFDLSDPWPCEEDLKILTKKSSGLFIFASTLARFIESEYHEPMEQLRLIVNSPDSTIHEGRAGIDPLYAQVLEHAFLDAKDATVFVNFRRVVGAVILAFNPLSRTQIAKILDINPSLISATLRHLHSVFLIPNEGFKAIRVFHKSFPDFMQDRDRCLDSKFFINSSAHHGDMALGCLELLKKLRQNPCGLPDFVMNQDVTDPLELLEDKVGSAAQYACGYWAMHVRSSPTTGDVAIRLIESASTFFKNNAVPWIEIMSLENRLDSVIHSIYSILDWIDTVDAPTLDLRNLAQDCLRFTIHFFHLIQQSAPHIYHSALPLSPRSSMFSSAMLQEKTKVTDFYGGPNAWDATMRTIEASSGRFTCMASSGHRIAAACEDGSVGVYDSVTGALRLSLNPGGPVLAVRGSPDGSMLFCAHQGPLITVWDIQTGGLIHTFAMESQAENIAICSMGRYLACGLSDGSVKIWEVESKTEISTPGSGLPVTHLCWLEPGEQLVVARGSSAQIWDVVGRRVLRSFTVQGRICGVVYAQKLNRFAIATTSEAKSTIMVIDPRTGKSFTNGTSQRISCLAFSPITEDFVCSIDAPGLELFSVAERSWRHFDHPATITSVSTLSNGAAVVTGSSIQLLSLDEGHGPPQQPTFSTLNVHVFDEGNIIAIIPTSREYITLLDSATMSTLLTTPARAWTTSTGRLPILCASLTRRIAVFCFDDYRETCLELWRFGDKAPVWINQMSPMLKVASGISPSGSRLVVLKNNGPCTDVGTWNIGDGRPEAFSLIRRNWPSHPLEIKFESEDKFYSYHDTCRIPFTISPLTTPGVCSHSITRGEQQPLDERRRIHCDVDDAHEWVVSFSKRICWIPPGYIGSDRRCHWWAGDTLIMFGQDGVLRKLTFRVPS